MGQHEDRMELLLDPQEHTFHDAASQAGDGIDMVVKDISLKNLNIWVSGSSGNSARQVSFYSVDAEGNKYALMGVRTSDFATATSTTGKGEEWQFDISGKHTIRMDLDSMTGGTVTVKGKAVA